jgi:hypothetical protein
MPLVARLCKYKVSLDQPRLSRTEQPGAALRGPSLPKKLTLPDPETLIQLAERGGYNANLEGRQALEHAIETRRGGVWLELTDAQDRKLTRDGEDRKL